MRLLPLCALPALLSCASLSPRHSANIAHEALAATVIISYARGHGSGFAIGPHVIVTAAHVMDSEDLPVITTSAGEECDISMVAMSPSVDISLVWVENCTLPTLTLSDHDLVPGDEVWATGHPLDLGPTVTRGVASQVGTRLQMDAALLPGMSGGPVVDRHGHVVGVGVGITTRDGLFAGVSWAVLARDIPGHSTHVR